MGASSLPAGATPSTARHAKGTHCVSGDVAVGDMRGGATPMSADVATDGGSAAGVSPSPLASARGGAPGRGSQSPSSRLVGAAGGTPGTGMGTVSGAPPAKRARLARSGPAPGGEVADVAEGAWVSPSASATHPAGSRSRGGVGGATPTTSTATRHHPPRRSVHVAAPRPVGGGSAAHGHAEAAVGRDGRASPGRGSHADAAVPDFDTHLLPAEDSDGEGPAGRRTGGNVHAAGKSGMVRDCTPCERDWPPPRVQ